MKNLDLDILHRKLEGSLNTTEEEEFNLWMKASAKNREYFERLKVYHEKSIEDFGIDTVPNTTDLFMKRINKKSRQNTYEIFLRYAAVILLPLIIGAGLWIYSNGQINSGLADQKNKLLTEEETHQTVLITSNGESYKLESGEEQAVVEDQGVKIRKYLRAGLKYEKQEKQENKKIAYNTLRTSKGDDYQVELSDGTIVYLNCGSELRYPVSFGDNERRVELKGEAFFDVSKTGNKFIVEVNNMEVEVLGTKFNVMAYDDENTIQTTLVSGKVKVAVDEKGVNKSLILRPGDQANWNSKSGKLQSKQVNTNLYTSWVDGYFRFENQKLEDIMRNIARWYDVKIFYQNPELKNKRLTGKLHKVKDFTVISDMIEKISGVEIDKNKNAVVISMKE